MSEIEEIEEINRIIARKDLNFKPSLRATINTCKAIYFDELFYPTMVLASRHGKYFILGLILRVHFGIGLDKKETMEYIRNQIKRKQWNT